MPLLDTAQLDAMASGMPELLLPIVTDFEASGRDSLGTFRAALAGEHFAEAQGILHQLKGAAGTMGLIRFQDLCRECEEQVAARINPPRAAELEPLLLQSVQGAVAYLNAPRDPA